MAKFLLSSVMAIGKSLARKKVFKPKFTEKDFQEGAASFKQRVAEDFLDFCVAYYNSNPPDIQDINKLLNTKLKANAPLKGLKVDDGVLFVSDNYIVRKYTYEEVWAVIEYGRKDKNVDPHPILRTCFEQYRKKYRTLVKKFLKGQA